MPRTLSYNSTASRRRQNTEQSHGPPRRKMRMLNSAEHLKIKYLNNFTMPIVTRKFTNLELI